MSFLRYNECTQQDIFCIQLARASMLQNTSILLEQPFSLLDEEVDTSLIVRAIKALDIDCHRITILDLYHQKNFYQEDLCHIEKCS